MTFWVRSGLMNKFKGQVDILRVLLVSFLALFYQPQLAIYALLLLDLGDIALGIN